MYTRFLNYRADTVIDLLGTFKRPFQTMWIITIFHRVARGILLTIGKETLSTDYNQPAQFIRKKVITSLTWPEKIRHGGRGDVALSSEYFLFCRRHDVHLLEMNHCVCKPYSNLNSYICALIDEILTNNPVYRLLGWIIWISTSRRMHLDNYFITVITNQDQQNGFLFRTTFSNIFMKFALKVPNNDKPALAQIMAWCRTGDELSLMAFKVLMS